MSDNDVQLEDRIRVGQFAGKVDQIHQDDSVCYVVFDDTAIPADWYRLEDVVLLPREAKDPVDLVASALTSAERSFSFDVGQGTVPPGQYLTDRDKARKILEALDEAGYEVRLRD